MTAAAILEQLEAMGTVQNRKVYARHGVAGLARIVHEAHGPGRFAAPISALLLLDDP